MPLYPLRDYQQEAHRAVMNWIKYRPGQNAYVKAPGGAGKSVLIAACAEACYALGERVAILTRSEKLLTQNFAQLAPEYQQFSGIYCAGIGRYELDKPILFASIQSITNKGKDLKINRVLIDEIQNLHPDEESDTQYWNFIRDLGNPPIQGWTATDFRTGSGSLKFGRKIYDIPIKPLIDKGFLIPPINKVVHDIDLSDVTIVRSKYDDKQLEEIYLDDKLLDKSISILKQYTKLRHSVVIFAQSRNHGKILQQAMVDNGMHAVFVDGDMDKEKELNPILEDFQNRKIKFLINVDLLVEGWDCPTVDCVAVFTSTMSKGKFEQILYRGTRLAPHLNKTDFLVLDLGGNFESHGALGSPYTEPSKKEIKQKKGKICPSCEEYVMPPSLMECPDCGYVFTPAEARQINHESTPDFASDAIYDGDSDIEKFQVLETQYKIHRSLKGSMSLKVEYLISGHKYPISEWLSPYGSRSAYVKQWLLERGHDIYGDINQYSLDDLLFFTNKLNSPTHIQAKRNGKYYNITGYYFE